MMRRSPARIVLAGGGTAGHVEPALAVAEALRRLDSTLEIEFLGTDVGLERLLVPQRGYILRTIPKVTLPRRISIDLLKFPIELTRSIFISRKILKGAQCVVGFGGYVSASAYLGAKLSAVPIALHEANAKPGWANRLGRHFADLIAVNFEGVQRDWPGSILTGMPIRTSLTELAKLDESGRRKFRELNAKSWNFDPDKPIVAVFGGSQGSTHINAAVADYLARPASEIQVIHAVGISNPLPSASLNYLPMPYFHDMAAIYGSADLMVTRSGAVTCSELMTVGCSAILIPLPHGNGEQIDNAAALVNQGRAIALENESLTGKWLQDNLLPVVRSAMAKRVNPSSLNMDAAERIAKLISSKFLTHEGVNHD